MAWTTTVVVAVLALKGPALDDGWLAQPLSATASQKWSIQILILVFLVGMSGTHAMVRAILSTFLGAASWGLYHVYVDLMYGHVRAWLCLPPGPGN